MTVPAPQRRDVQLQAACLYLITEARLDGGSIESMLAGALAGGVDIVQLRDKSADDASLIETGRLFRRICDQHGALLVVNDRGDLAVACEADGVHVGQDDAPVASIRATVGDERLIGVSTHSEAQIDAASQSGCDYIAVGPVFETPTKPGAAPVGTRLVDYAARHSQLPFFAIGGIDAGNAADVVDAGATRLAVVRAIRDAADPRAAAAQLRTALAG